MSFLDVLSQYVDHQPGTAPPEAARHFEQVAQSAPPHVLSEGLADAFRADETPPFGQMVGQLFGNSDPQQRAGLLNQMLGSLGPGVLAAIASGPLHDMFARSAGASPQITPDQANALRPDQVQDIATKAEEANPGIVDRVSQFYSQHPGLVRTLGSAALAIVLAKMAQRNNA
jgi:hypothetical protein